MKISVTVTGIDEALDKLETLKRGTRNKHVRKAVRAGIAPQLKATRAAMTFADDTGKLRRSIISKIKTFTSGITSGVVGPRNQVIDAYSRSKKRNVKRNPAKYAHLVEYGHKVAVGGGLRDTYAIEWSVVNGKRRKRRNLSKLLRKATGVHRGDVPARPFMGPAFDRSKDEATAAFKAKLVESLMAEASQ